MSGVSKAQIEKAKEVDLLSYLQHSEPSAVRNTGSGEYCLVEHDSLKISNGKWHWFSHRIGGRIALDFLIHVRGMAFVEAVRTLVNECAAPAFSCQPVKYQKAAPIQKQAVFTLPHASENNHRIIAYLQSRGIDRAVIDHCINAGLLYENAKTHNCVFVGADVNGTPRFACQRGTRGSFKQDVEGSDKRYAFSITAIRDQADSCLISVPLYVFESAIDALSFATIQYRHEKHSWNKCHYLALSGTSPLALEQYLRDRPEIESVRLCLDNDSAGRKATESIQAMLGKHGLQVTALPPPTGKDWNEALQNQSKSITTHSRRPKEAAISL